MINIGVEDNNLVKFIFFNFKDSKKIRVLCLV